MRIPVTIASHPAGVEVIPETGEPYVLEEGSVWAPGSSIGGYLVVRDGEGVALIRVTGREKSSLHAHPWVELEYRNRSRVASAVLRPGDRGLLAYSAGAAQRGILHRHGHVGPIGGWMRQHRLPSAGCIEVRATLDGLQVQSGGSACSHRTTASSSSAWACANPREYGRILTWGDSAPDTHANQYHRGCQQSADTLSLDDPGDWVVEMDYHDRNGGRSLRVSGLLVYLTTGTPEEAVLPSMRSLCGCATCREVEA